MSKHYPNGNNQHNVETTSKLPDAVAAWVKRAQKTPLLTADEEKELGRRIAKSSSQDDAEKADAEVAYKHMVEANLRLVIAMALKKCQQGDNHSLTLADLIDAGHSGLMRAARKFDPALGYRFSTYASFWIYSAIRRRVHDATLSVEGAEVSP